MHICTFFGHSNTPQNIRNILKETVERLITEKDIDMFYIGNQGNFDSLAKNVLDELSEKYAHIRYNIVLAYRPTNTESEQAFDFSHTIYPEEVAASHPRYAILKRNRWMIEHSDYVISYITHDFGGAAKAIDLCRKKNKKIINVANTRHSNS